MHADITDIQSGKSVLVKILKVELLHLPGSEFIKMYTRNKYVFANNIFTSCESTLEYYAFWFTLLRIPMYAGIGKWWNDECYQKIAEFLGH